MLPGSMILGMDCSKKNTVDHTGCSGWRYIVFSTCAHTFGSNYVESTPVCEKNFTTINTMNFLTILHLLHTP